MNEDLKPIYDFEADWKPCNSGKDKVLIFENAKLSSLFRVIDMKEQTINFSDIDRVKAIKNIDKILTKSDDEEENRKRFLSLANRIIDEVKPIEMPYAPEKLTCFIENFPGFDKNYPDTVGILYFREEKEDGNMIQAKRFFKINPVGASAARFEEIDLETYNKVKVDYYGRCKDGMDNRSDRKTVNKC